MILSLGIDVGSTAIKVVGIDGERKIVLSLTEETQPKIEDQIEDILNNIKKESLEMDKNLKIVATGYGRKLVKEADERISEITCHARGIFEIYKSGGTIIDIGGQDTKIIQIDESGKVIDFIMNDKCAAGTGRFLETSAWRLKIPVEKFGEIAISTKEEVEISSTCAVFAESEVISKLAHGEKLEAVIRGLHHSLVKRVMGMVFSIGLAPPIFLSGGVVKNCAIQKMIEKECKTIPKIPEDPQIIGAYGAAVLGIERQKIFK